MDITADDRLTAQLSDALRKNLKRYVTKLNNEIQLTVASPGAVMTGQINPPTPKQVWPVAPSNELSRQKVSTRLTEQRLRG